MSAKKPTVDTQACPNCNAQLTVPKSTRSFICKSCDAILKVVSTDDGVELKVVGKSVDDDPSYQALEARIAQLKTELAELHKIYEAEALRPVAKTGARIRLLGIVGLLAGLAIAFANAQTGAIVAGAGLAVAVVGWLLYSSARRAKQSGLTEMSATIARLGEERDASQRKAAMMKVEST